MDGGPWSYDNHALLYERVHQGINLEIVTLDSLILWIQVQGLPVGYMSDAIAQRIGVKC